MQPCGSVIDCSHAGLRGRGNEVISAALRGRARCCPPRKPAATAGVSREARTMREMKKFKIFTAHSTSSIRITPAR